MEGEGGLVHVSIKAEELFAIGPLVVTNSMVGALLASLLLLAAGWYVTRSATLIPGRLQSAIELPFEFVVGLVAGQGGTRWRSFLPLVASLFMMILVANWLGLLPGVGTVGITHHGEHGDTLVPIVRPASADYNFTVGLAIVTFVTFVGFGIRANGVGGYLKEFLGEPRYMAPLMAPIHIISELSRLISLSMRLFGNVFAGEVLLTTMLALTTIAWFTLPLAFVVPAVFLGLEIIFGVVQALVFALLTMTYISLAIAEHHGGESGGERSGHASRDKPHEPKPGRTAEDHVPEPAAGVAQP